MDALAVIEREAHVAGVRDVENLSLGAIDQRRSQLWFVAFVVMAGLGACVVMLSLVDQRVAVHPAFRAGLLPLIVTLVLYVGEKERHLRRLTRLLLEERALNAELMSDLSHDPLTGLLSRTALHDRLVAAMARSTRTGRPFALLSVDVDRFEKVNAVHGHHVGDLLLVEAARRLRTVVRGDDAVARLGGDEFTLLLEDLDASRDGVEAAQRVMEVLRAPMQVGELRLNITASVGIVVQLGSGREVPSDLLKAGTLATQLAKRKGRNRSELFDRAGTTTRPV